MLREIARVLFVVIHVARRLNVLPVEPCAAVIRIGVEHHLQALLGPRDVVAIFVRHRKGEQRVDVRSIDVRELLVEADRFVLFAEQIKRVGEAIHVLGLFAELHRFAERLDRHDAIAVLVGLEARLEVLLRRGRILSVPGRADHGVENVLTQRRASVCRREKSMPQPRPTSPDHSRMSSIGHPIPGHRPPDGVRHPRRGQSPPDGVRPPGGVSDPD